MEHHENSLRKHSHSRGHLENSFCRCNFIHYVVMYLVRLYQTLFKTAVCKQTSSKCIIRSNGDNMPSEAVFCSVGRSHKRGRVHIAERCTERRSRSVCCLALCTANRLVLPPQFCFLSHSPRTYVIKPTHISVGQVLLLNMDAWFQSLAVSREILRKGTCSGAEFSSIFT